MPKREFSAAFRTFVNKNITSVEQIEVLLMAASEPNRAWTIEEISASLRSSTRSIATRLDALKRAKLLSGSAAQGYRYSAEGHAADMVNMLASEYGQRRFSVIELVFSRPDAARAFADAFLFKEEPEE